MISELNPKLINVKQNDLAGIVKPQYCEEFGLFYFCEKESVYQSQTGFLIKEELEFMDSFI
jgi:hypothetical protein